MTLQIQMDSRAKNWIESKGNLVTVKMLKAKGCCGGGPMELHTEYRKPEHLDLFHEIKVDNLSVYVQKNIEAKDNTLHLHLSGFGFFSSISATGLSRF